MGRATILGGGADGLYSVKIDTGKAAQTARLAALAARLAALVPELARAQGLLSVQQVLEALAEVPVQSAIAAYVTATRLVPADTAAVKAALAVYTAAQAKLQAEKATTAQLRIPVELLEAEQAQITKDQATWAALVLEETASAWCADLTEDASGSVATVEIPGENALVIIAPAAPAPTAADGLLTAREVMSGPQAFWNAAALPGWQRWMPTYRRGVVTAVNLANDTANVTLTADNSSAQNLPINAVDTLANVPVQYMTCNASVFEPGDACVVKFLNHDWAQPRVVGFVDHPKSCGGTTLLVLRMKVIMPEPPADTDFSTAYLFDDDAILLKRWIWRLSDSDPLDLSKAKLEDYGLTAQHRVISRVPTDPPFEGIYSFQNYEDTQTAVTSAGKYGHTQTTVLMYAQAVVTAGPTVLESTYYRHEQRPRHIYDEHNDVYGAPFTYKNWAANLQKTHFLAGYDVWEELYPQPTVPPASDTGDEVIETWLVGNPTTKTVTQVCMGKWELWDPGTGLEWRRIGTYSIDVGASTDVAAPALEPVSSFPYRPAARYTKAEIGALPSGANFIIAASGIVYDRNGYVVTPVNSMTPGTPVNDTHLMYFHPTNKTMRLLLPTSAGGALVGSTLDLGAVPALASDTDLADVLANTTTWNPVTNTRFLLARPAAAGPGRYTESVSVELIYDSLDGVDPAARWPR